MDADTEGRRFYIEHLGCFVVGEALKADQDDCFAGGFWDLLESAEDFATMVWLDQNRFCFEGWRIAFEGFVDLVSDRAKEIGTDFSPNRSC